MKAIVMEEFGGPEVAQYVDVPDPAPQDGEVVVEVERVGVNFADTHAIRDDYLAPQSLPLTPGGEIAGRTPDGRRVAALLPTGGYAQRVAVPESNLVPIPDGVTDDVAAGLLLQGLTARSLLRVSARLAEGESVVVGAAGGGTGSLSVQLAKRFGAGRVIALASTEEKRALAERLGAHQTFESGARLPERVDAVFETVGKATWPHSMRSVKPGGTIVVSGSTSGPDPSADLQRLFFMQLRVVGSMMGTRDELAALLEFCALKGIRPQIGTELPMSDASAGFEQMLAGETAGKIVFTR
jgi:NADPH:quinone reductase-like Zn-dependent oxidoreductase